MLYMKGMVRMNKPIRKKITSSYVFGNDAPKRPRVYTTEYINPEILPGKEINVVYNKQRHRQLYKETAEMRYYVILDELGRVK